MTEQEMIAKMVEAYLDYHFQGADEDDGLVLSLGDIIDSVNRFCDFLCHEPATNSVLELKHRLVQQISTRRGL